MSIRTRLIALALAIVLPGVIGASWGLHALYQQQKTVAAENLVELSRAMASVVERELARREAMLQTLALSPALARGDLKVFYDFAQSAAPTNERTVVLIAADGRQLINTRLPFGQPLPVSKAFSGLTASEPAGTVITNLYFAPVGKRHSFAIRIPLLKGAQAGAYLALGSYAETLQPLVNDARLNAGWNVSVIDRNGVIVARRIRPVEFVGLPATQDFRKHMSAAREGAFETVRLDGTRTFTAYGPIGNTGWTLALSMPRSEIDAQIVSALNVTVLITAVLLVLAVLAATYVGFTISRPTRQLVNLASALGRGEPITAPTKGLLEMRLVAAELQQASERIRTANAEQEQRVLEAVDESRRAQEALLQNQKLEALGKLTGGIAHDFNNLLQTISAAIEVSLRLGSDPVKQAMHAGKRAVERATRLTRQLTTFGRGTVSAPATIDLQAHITEFRDLIEGALRGNIDLKFNMAEGLWRVFVDPVQLELAVLNAALNARDAMPQGGRLEITGANVTLEAGNKWDLPQGDYVRIAIIDNGEGVKPADLQRVFEPFYTTKPVGKGSGLGLAQIYGFARQSDGMATIDSSVGKGTTVAMLLPRSTRADTKLSTAPADAAPEDAGGCTVLFVEDDELVSEVVVPGLRSNGYEVVTAHDVTSALEAIRGRPVDVVLSDVVMPGRGDGFYLADQIRREYPHVPIVLATGYSDALTASSPFRVLLKPYTINEAVAALSHELRRFKRKGMAPEPTGGSPSAPPPAQP